MFFALSERCLNKRSGIYKKTIMNLDGFVKSHECNYRWLSKKVYIQGVVDGTFYDAINLQILHIYYINKPEAEKVP